MRGGEFGVQRFVYVGSSQWQKEWDKEQRGWLLYFCQKSVKTSRAAPFSCHKCEVVFISPPFHFRSSCHYVFLICWLDEHSFISSIELVCLKGFDWLLLNSSGGQHYTHQCTVLDIIWRSEEEEEEDQRESRSYEKMRIWLVLHLFSVALRFFT